MSEQQQPTALDTLRPTLDAIPEADVKQPGDGVEHALTNAGTLLANIEENDEISKALLRIGLKASTFEDLKISIAALRASQMQLERARAPRRKPDDQKALEESSGSLRDDLLAACRWNLRHNLSVQTTLNAIAEGQSVGDLIADLNTLAQIIEDNVKTFSTDKSFDSKAQVKAARAAAESILEGVSDRRPTIPRAEAMTVRNRAWTHFTRVYQELRDAAQYAFRKQPEKLALFQDTEPTPEQVTTQRKKRTPRTPKETNGAHGPATTDLSPEIPAEN